MVKSAEMGLITNNKEYKLSGDTVSLNFKRVWSAYQISHGQLFPDNVPLAHDDMLRVLKESPGFVKLKTAIYWPKKPNSNTSGHVFNLSKTRYAQYPSRIRKASTEFQLEMGIGFALTDTHENKHLSGASQKDSSKLSDKVNPGNVALAFNVLFNTYGKEDLVTLENFNSTLEEIGLSGFPVLHFLLELEHLKLIDSAPSGYSPDAKPIEIWVIRERKRWMTQDVATYVANRILNEHKYHQHLSDIVNRAWGHVDFDQKTTDGKGINDTGLSFTPLPRAAPMDPRINLCARIPTSIKKQLELIAKENHRSVSSLVEMAIRIWLSKQPDISLTNKMS